MNVEALEAQFRSDVDDEAQPYLWKQAEVLRWFDEAQQEAALRGRLILETTLPAVTQIPVLVGTTSYLLHKSLFELTNLRFKATGETRSEWLKLVTRPELDRIRPHWRDETDDRPLEFVFQDDKTLTLAQVPQRTGILYLEGYRMPLAVLDDGAKTPEINAAHHRHLVLWAVHRAFIKPDTEVMDPKRADAAEAEFTRYFGKRPDSGLRRETQHNTPQYNRAW